MEEWSWLTTLLLMAIYSRLTSLLVKAQMCRSSCKILHKDMTWVFFCFNHFLCLHTSSQVLWLRSSTHLMNTRSRPLQMSYRLSLGLQEVLIRIWWSKVNVTPHSLTKHIFDHNSRVLRLIIELKVKDKIKRSTVTSWCKHTRLSSGAKDRKTLQITLVK